MASKPVKSPLLSIGVISAISAVGVLFGGMAANAQTGTTDTTVPGQSTTQQNQLPSGTNQSPTQVNPSQNVPTSPTQINPSVDPSGSTNTTPSTSGTSGSISQYSPNQAPILRPGSQGQAVRDVQAYLSQQGLYSNAPDGVYGPQTRDAVRKFQQSRNLPADGIVGPQTWSNMLSGQDTSGQGSSGLGTGGQGTGGQGTSGQGTSGQ